MPITPIHFSRVSHNMKTLAMLDALRTNTTKLFREFARIETGNEFVSPSDNPVKASRALDLTEILEQQDQILENLRSADSFLAATDAAVGNIHELLLDARDIASAMASNLNDQAQRDSQAVVVDAILDQLVALGNRKFNDIYIFGGRNTTGPSFETSPQGGVRYTGDLGDLETQVGLVEPTAINLVGQDLFGGLSTQVIGYVDLDPQLTTDTRLEDVTGAIGKGIRPGQVTFAVSSPAAGFTVDLSMASNVGDVIDLINDAAANAGLQVGPGGAGDEFYAEINPAGNGLQISVFGGGTVAIGEVGNGKTAADLGITQAVPGAAVVVGGDLDAKLTAMTSLTDLQPPTPLPAGNGSITIQLGTTNQEISFAGATTLQDILNVINASGLGVRAEINAAATGINVFNEVSGIDMRISEGSTPGAGAALGILSMHGQTELAQLNGGRGVKSNAGQADLRIHDTGGIEFLVDVTGAVTLQDVADRITTAAAAAGSPLTASVNSSPSGNSIRLSTAAGPDALVVLRENLSFAIDDLGLNKAAPVGATTLDGDDVRPVAPSSMFTTLLKLAAALRASDDAMITEAGSELEQFIDDANRVQGSVGARSQAMQKRVQHTEDAVTATRVLLSEVKDLDYTEAVTTFQQAQAALQATLLAGNQLLNVSLLDFL